MEILTGDDFDSTVWERRISKLEADNPLTVSVVSVHASSSEEEPEKVEIVVESSKSDSSAEQFGVIRGRESAENTFELIAKETKKIRLAKLNETVSLAEDVIGGEKEDTIRDLSEMNPDVRDTVLEAGVWAVTTRDPGCRIFTLSGKPINNQLIGVSAQVIEDSTFGGTVFKAFSTEGSRILGSGGFGVAVLVTDRTDPTPITWDKVVLKIEASPEVDLTEQDVASNRRKLGEVTLGMLLDKVFYEPRVTPSVTRSYSVFQCKTLPPTTGAWGNLTRQIQFELEPKLKKLPESGNQFLYTEQEWADRGTIGDFIDGIAMETGFVTLKKNPAERVEVTKSLVFQGLHALEAFRRAGFVHADINPNNVALTSVKGTTQHFYFINGDGSNKAAIQAFKPFRPGLSLNDLMIKFIDYGHSRFSHASAKNNPGRTYAGRIPGEITTDLFTSIASQPPEAYARGTKDADTLGFGGTWYVSSAVDLWQFGLVIASFALGDNPLVKGLWYRYKPPRQFIEFVKTALRSNKIYQELVINEMEVIIANHLWNIAELIGLPWTVPGRSKINKSTRDRIVKNHPLYYAFKQAEEANLINVIMTRGGLLRLAPVYIKVLGPLFLPMLYSILAWDPNDRPTPGQVIQTLSVDYFKPFSDAAASVVLTDPLNVSIEQYTRFMKHAATAPHAKTWSVMTTDISYHVDISETIGHIISSNGRSRFTKLPAPIYRELVTKITGKEKKKKNVWTCASSRRGMSLTFDSDQFEAYVSTHAVDAESVSRKKEAINWSMWL